MRWCAALIVMLAATALIASACDDSDVIPKGLYLTPIAQARAASLPVYWLGKSFTADGEEFPAMEGAFSPGMAGVAVNGVEIDYESDRGNLQIATLPEAEWLKVEDKMLHPAQASRAFRSDDVTVAGHPATMLSDALGDRPVNGRTLVVHLDQGVVVAQTSAFGVAADHRPRPSITSCLMLGATPQPGDRGNIPIFSLCGTTPTPTRGPDVNPLIDRATFLAVLQGLRPYP